MACLDDRGRLFVGDSTGVNWNKKQLLETPPHRILMLEDTNGDGLYDRSTIFADALTFPQGGCWLNGSLYVCSPPGIWKLTDTDHDGVADARECIVTGFDFTGNAADVHGPWLHPNGRLFWCHGRKGHSVFGKEGVLVHEGLASGIWSCTPDGSDVRWHSLGSGDNPVKVDFTPEGEVIGVENLYFNDPRGDTLVHWLPHGVYERSDQLNAIAGLPRTLDQMPILHNFGHVGVSGSCFAHTGVLFPKSPASFFVTHFNTQRLMRIELTPQGSSFHASPFEFLKIQDPDVHLTDVIEAADGSLLLVNTGGWFRAGCPASLLAKPDLLGCIYRITKRNAPQKPVLTPFQLDPPPASQKSLLAKLTSPFPFERRRALELVSDTRDISLISPEIKTAVLAMLSDDALDAPLEHSLIHAVFAQKWNVLDLYEGTSNNVEKRRILKIAQLGGALDSEAILQRAEAGLLSGDVLLARLFASLIASPLAEASPTAAFLQKFSDSTANAFATRLPYLLEILAARLNESAFARIVAELLQGNEAAQHTALSAISKNSAPVLSPLWEAPLTSILEQAPGPALFDALKKLKTPLFDPRLKALAEDPSMQPSLRLRALDTMKSLQFSEHTFSLLIGFLTDASTSAAAKIQSASMLSSAQLTLEQQQAISPLLASCGPVELAKFVPLLRKCKDDPTARSLCVNLAKNPAITSIQESVLRTALSAQKPDLFETLILPALQKANAAGEEKKRRLTPLSDRAKSAGSPERGRLVFESGKGSCIACHKIGSLGRSFGPDLSKIGSIRNERDLLESILFPSNTIARDYETHTIETRAGESVIGLIKGHTAEGLILVDASAQERSLRHTDIVSDTIAPLSLMPAGLETTLSESELLDLVAWLRSAR